MKNIESGLKKNLLSGFSKLVKSESSKRVSNKNMADKPSQITATEQDYEIYNKLLEYFFEDLNQTIVQNETKDLILLAFKPYAYRKLLNCVPQLNSSFITKIKKLNKESYFISEEKLISVRKVLSPSRIKNLINNTSVFGNETNYSEPISVIRFSKPLFTANNIAVVEYTHFLSNTLIGEIIVVLRKANKDWSIRYHKNLI